MRSDIGCQRDIVLAIEANTVDVREIWILASLTCIGSEPDGARLLVAFDDLHDRPFTAGDAVLQLSGLEIVEIKLTPVVAFGIPDEVVGCPEHAPSGARLVLCSDSLVVNPPESAGGGIRDTQPNVLMIPRYGCNRELRCVRT